MDSRPRACIWMKTAILDKMRGDRVVTCRPGVEQILAQDEWLAAALNTSTTTISGARISRWARMRP